MMKDFYLPFAHKSSNTSFYFLFVKKYFLSSLVLKLFSATDFLSFGIFKIPSTDFSLALIPSDLLSFMSPLFCPQFELNLEVPDILSSYKGFYVELQLRFLPKSCAFSQSSIIYLNILTL